MREKEKALIFSYILSQQKNLEDELQQLQSNIRYRKIDVVDCVEMMCVIERMNAFCQFSRDIISLLNLSEKENIDNE